MNNNKSKIFWLLMAILAIAVSGSIILLGWGWIRKAIRERGEAVPEAKIPELKDRLDHNPGSLFCYDPFTSYRLKPSFQGFRHDSGTYPHVTNAAGILGREEVNPDPEVMKYLFLGDSVTYGSYLPYEQTFVSRMQTLAGPSYQLLNTACPGWSTHQELFAYERYFSEIPHQAVIVIFCLNDLLRFEWIWRDESSFQMSAELRGLGGLVQSSFTGAALKKLRSRFLADAGLSPLAELNNTCLNAYLPEAWDTYLGENRPTLMEIARREILVMAAMPGRPQLQSLNQGGEAEIVLYPQIRLKYFCSEHRIGFVDLLPAFRSPSGKYDVSLFLEGEEGMLHLSEEGHSRVAEYLWGELSKITCRLSP